MKINVQPKPTTTIAPYMTGFVVMSTQIGVGILGYQRVVAAESGHDAWISVAIAGLLSHLTIWIICRTLRHYPSADLFGIHRDVYGKIIGNLFSLLYILYFIAMAMVILRGYIEVVQSWIFPGIPIWILGSILLFLAMYTVLGGIRVITGYAIISVFITIWLFFDLYFTLEYARWHYLLPVMEADFKQLLKGALIMAFTSVGYEVLYSIYPYVGDKTRLHRHAQWGAFITNFIYVVLMIISLIFFSEGQLIRTIWPTLRIKTVVYFPFLERFEYLAISLWMLIILPNVMLYMWSASRGCKRMFGWNQKRVLYIIGAVIFIAMQFFVSRHAANYIIDRMSYVSLYMAVIYPYVLLLGVLIKRRWNRREDSSCRDPEISGS